MMAVFGLAYGAISASDKFSEAVTTLISLLPNRVNFLFVHFTFRVAFSLTLPVLFSGVIAEFYVSGTQRHL